MTWNAIGVTKTLNRKVAGLTDSMAIFEYVVGAHSLLCAPTTEPYLAAK